MNRDWLLINADTPIRYNLAHREEDAELLPQNGEVSVWLSRLAERSRADDIGAIHGSHDYRMENILGKCWILGLSKSLAWFTMALKDLSRYKNENGRYQFPPHMVTEKPDSYVIFGGHMNAGENKKAKLYSEMISTYWMERVQA